MGMFPKREPETQQYAAPSGGGAGWGCSLSILVGTLFWLGLVKDINTTAAFTPLCIWFGGWIFLRILDWRDNRRIRAWHKAEEAKRQAREEYWREWRRNETKTM
jgi:hypothetical protein